MNSGTLPSPEDLRQVFLAKYGAAHEMGPVPARRWKAGYFSAADIYEATVARHIFPRCSWLDVGGGHDIFPENPALAIALASRCSAVVAVDPDPAVNENALVTERHQTVLESYDTDRKFDIATMRMVVEHVAEPERFVRTLRKLMLPGALVIVFTINRWSPISVLSKLVPFSLHHPIKRFFWGGHERDTFPVQYRMNTRDALRRLFEAEGFAEVAFAYLDDLSTFGSFKSLGRLELAAWSVSKHVGLTYPENCLLGIYRAPAD